MRHIDQLLRPRVEQHTIAFKRTQVVFVLLPGILKPELSARHIEFAERRMHFPLISRLCNYSLPHAASPVGFAALNRPETGGGVKVEPTISVQVDEVRPVGPAHIGHAVDSRQRMEP